QPPRVAERPPELARHATHEGDDLDRLETRLMRTAAEVNDELLPSRHERHVFQLQPANEIEERLVLGPHACQLHVFGTQPAEEERARRVEPAQAADIERPRLALLHPLAERRFGLRERTDVERAL